MYHIPGLLQSTLLHHQQQYFPVVPFNAATDKVLLLNLSGTNKQLPKLSFDKPNVLEQYINGLVQNAGARYGYGGYAELREVYGATAHFDGGPGEEPRRFHLGADIWAAAGTPVMAPISGLVHSFGFNNNLGDYGATIILSHSLNGVAFYTLYGHLSLDSLSQLREGQYVVGGSPFAWLGVPAENGGWPPHLHFQIIEHIGNYWADYPGVCRYSERNQYLTNCPNPELILQWMPYAMAH